jgi:uncharacterized protein YcbK (DUF882 family)
MGSGSSPDTAITSQRGLGRAVTRRGVLRLGAAASLLLAIAPRAVLAQEAAPRLISFNNLHTGEQLKTTFWTEGQYVPEALREIDQILRDFRTGDVKAIDPRLLDVLHLLRNRLDSRGPFEVISGYRSPATNALLHERSNGVASSSFHTRGMAIDIRLPDRTLADIHRVALSVAAGGVGYYPSSDFVHVDVGPVRRWG